MAVFLVNSRLGLLSAAPFPFRQEPHFSRSYVRILPSSLTRVLPSTLGYSPLLPVSVSGTDRYRMCLGAFPGAACRCLRPPREGAPPRIASERLLARSSTALLRDGVPSPRAMHATRPAFAPLTGGRIFTAFPSATLLSLALGSDFPGADCPCPGDLRFSVGGDLTRLFVTYACILSPASSSAPRGHAFAGLRDAPLPVMPQRHESRASVPRLAPLHCLRGGARPVSCYALFQGMAASEPTSWLSAHPHLISHSAWLWDLGRGSGLFPSRR